MTKLPDIIAAYSNREKTLRESAADLGAIILEREREEQYYGKHSKRLAELKKLAALQEKVVDRMLDESIEGEERPKGPRLTIAPRDGIGRAF